MATQMRSYLYLYIIVHVRTVINNKYSHPQKDETFHRRRMIFAILYFSIAIPSRIIFTCIYASYFRIAELPTTAYLHYNPPTMHHIHICIQYILLFLFSCLTSLKPHPTPRHSHTNR
ncbi:hypothetical protein P280DRAFT_222370 [Massarina eburnea CBS 473.64]|uniref:Uncharacterized protein n=1 Tax=Massarina eburnea CBS 473.64 TaxID=1395130 RepID=A0A6A6SB27_9PLEO|nr:hypothetical protein P280DRAFT_222370 [Massarina eburnea CBS 473.64]